MYVKLYTYHRNTVALSLHLHHLMVNNPDFLETMPQLVAAQVSKMQKCQRENNEEQRVGLFPYTANYYSQYIDKRDDTWHLALATTTGSTKL